MMMTMSTTPIKSGRSVLKMIETLWKISLKIAEVVRVLHVNFTVITNTFSERKWIHYFRTVPRANPIISHAKLLNETQLSTYYSGCMYIHLRSH
jgi:hypothetical protein